MVDLLADKLAQPGIGWSIGVFGALAEFERDPAEPAELRDLSVATPRGAIRLEPLAGCEALPYEPRSAKQQNRSLGIALCLSQEQARVGRNTVLTELGPDHAAIRAQDRSALLFDLGIDTPYGVFCVRTADAAHTARLRENAGKVFLTPGNPFFREMVAMSPHRVFISRLGRIEVYQPIAAPGARTPSGPHTHLLPRLVAARRTHSANMLLPPGRVPCASYYSGRDEADFD